VKHNCQVEVEGRLDRLYIRVHLWWVSRWIRRLLVVTGARCPLTKPAVTAVEQQAAMEPHCIRGVQPGGICVYVVQRGPTPGGLGPGLRRGSRRFLFQLPPCVPPSASEWEIPKPKPHRLRSASTGAIGASARSAARANASTGSGRATAGTAARTNSQ
jgi:hypothetical protein